MKLELLESKIKGGKSLSQSAVEASRFLFPFNYVVPFIFCFVLFYLSFIHCQ